MPRGVLKFALLDERERQLIEQFIDSLGGIGPRRVAKYRHYLGKIGADLGEPFESETKKDLLEYVKATNAGPYADATKRDISASMPTTFLASGLPPSTCVEGNNKITAELSNSIYAIPTVTGSPAEVEEGMNE